MSRYYLQSLHFYLQSKSLSMNAFKVISLDQPWDIKNNKNVLVFTKKMKEGSCIDRYWNRAANYQY